MIKIACGNLKYFKIFYHELRHCDNFSFICLDIYFPELK